MSRDGIASGVRRHRAWKFALGALALASFTSALTVACGGRAQREQGSEARAGASGAAGSDASVAGDGSALGGAVNAGSTGTGGAPMRPCTSDADCPNDGVCQTCADGSAVCPHSACNGVYCVDATPTCNCAPAQVDSGANDGSSGFRCTWQDCGGILCPAGNSCLCCGGFVVGCLCTTSCSSDADCTDPTRPVCNAGICSDNAPLCCGCP
jgi:hypothetical protein